MKKILFFLLLVLLIGCGKRANNSFGYTGEWKFRQSGTEEWKSASVPGVVHTDLLLNNMIEDPYAGINEPELQWIEMEDWEYRSIWNVDDETLNNDHIELIFNGLDTYAKVKINGAEVLSTDNMFRTWKTDVKPWLKAGENEISIHFTSPLNENREKVAISPYRLPSGNETVDLQVSAYTRKAAYQFGWDWGPRFVSSGIWREVEVNTWNDARLNDVYIKTRNIESEKAELEVNVTVESDEESYQEIQIDGDKNEIHLRPGKNEFQFFVSIDNPELWWPNGMGKPHLYEMDVKLLTGGDIKEEQTLTYGIRTVELVNEPDNIGTSYYFKVNGEPVFVRGANYIPQDIFPSRVDVEQYRELITRVKEANMNMLRIWGGGIYEDDYFYQLCDENGIMIWQDFMFAGSMYPTDTVFHHTVKEEVRDNIKRLRSHPSLALWCGNNEIEVAWNNWGWQQQYGYSEADSAEIWNNYLALFHNIISKGVEELSPHINYVTTSPLSNWGTPENFNHSSMHYWGVWHGREPFENFKSNVPRFMSEYGFQSFPSYKSLAAIADSPELNLDSEFISNRQKSYIGNDMITRFSEKYFGPSEDFEEYVVNSQKTQALAMRMAIQEHRLRKPHCMGTMFWQLNDVWQGPSWSVLEYDGQPKLAYDEVKKWYQDVVVISRETDDGVDLYVVSDRRTDFVGRLIVNQSSAGRMIQETTTDVELGKNEVKRVLSVPHPVDRIRLYEHGEVIFEDKKR